MLLINMVTLLLAPSSDTMKNYLNSCVTMCVVDNLGASAPQMGELERYLLACLLFFSAAVHPQTQLRYTDSLGLSS